MEKKRHTVKNIIVSDVNHKVLYLSETYEGKVHDKSICDEEGYEFPNGITVWMDTGFEGINPPNVIIKRPKKKPKGKDLTQEQKEEKQIYIKNKSLD